MGKVRTQIHDQLVQLRHFALQRCHALGDVAGAERLGHGKAYKYAHDFDGHWVDQDYLPTSRIYYRPTEQGQERTLKARLDAIRKARGIEDTPQTPGDGDAS